MRQADEDDPILPPAEETELLLALEAALRPGELAPEVNERLIDLALEDPLSPPSEAELVESARLRDALADGAAHEDEPLLAALRAPFAPVAIDELASRRALDAALGATSPGSAAVPGRRNNVVYAAFGAGSVVLAAAAAIALLTGTLRTGEPAAKAAFVTPHSTTGLFAEPFETGATTARMDRIAADRSRDLRNNRYAAWGVR